MLGIFSGHKAGPGSSEGVCEPDAARVDRVRRVGVGPRAERQVRRARRSHPVGGLRRAGEGNL